MKFSLGQFEAFRRHITKKDKKKEKIKLGAGWRNTRMIVSHFLPDFIHPGSLEN